MITCNNVKKKSIAEKMGIQPGDKILSINGAEMVDVFDYDFYTTEEDVTMVVEDADGRQRTVEIHKEQYEDLGLEFETYMIDCEKSCRNKCIFCFIDQMPKGMRDNLYFKDDDTRLSFLTGSYVTLTNIDDAELHRTVKYKLSPINISVHTTNPELRVKMLNNRFAGDILRKIRILTEGNIQVNCQIVLCKNINDGDELERTLGDLLTLIPHINSVSVVPVGITRYRDDLYPLEAFRKEDAEKVIATVDKWQQIFLDHMGSRVVYAADEFYVKAQLPAPDYDYYEDFPQLENGVGMLTLLETEADAELAARKAKRGIFKPKQRKVTIATGECAYETIVRLAKKVEEKFSHISVQVICVKNAFFGGEVTVAGLLTGADLLEQLQGVDFGEALLLSNDMFKDDGDMLLDDVTTHDLEGKLAVKVEKVYNSGKAFVEAILGVGGSK